MLKVVLVRAVEMGMDLTGEIDCLDFVLPVFECLPVRPLLFGAFSTVLIVDVVVDRDDVVEEA